MSRNICRNQPPVCKRDSCTVLNATAAEEGEKDPGRDWTGNYPVLTGIALCGRFSATSASPPSRARATSRPRLFLLLLHSKPRQDTNAPAAAAEAAVVNSLTLSIWTIFTMSMCCSIGLVVQTFFLVFFSFAPANAVVSTGLVIISGTLQSRTRKFSMVRPSLNRFRSKRHLRGMKTRMRCPMSNS